MVIIVALNYTRLLLSPLIFDLNTLKIYRNHILNPKFLNIKADLSLAKGSSIFVPETPV